MPNREEFMAQMRRDLSNDNLDSPHAGSFNNRTSIKTKKTKKEQAKDLKRGQNKFDLYVAFAEVTGSTYALAIGSRRLHTYFNSRLNPKDHTPSNKAAHIQLSTCSDIKENPFDLRLEAIQKVIDIADYAPASVDKKTKKTKSFVKKGDCLTIYTRDPYLHEMLSGTNIDAAGALAEFNAIGAHITLKVREPDDGCENTISAESTLQQHVNEQKIAKQNVRNNKSHRPTPTIRNYGFCK